MLFERTWRWLVRHERLVQKYLPLDWHVRDDVILLRDKSVFGMFDLAGWAWETKTISDIVHRTLSLTGVLKNIADDTVTLHFYSCRGHCSTDIYPKGRFRTGFAEALDQAYCDSLFDRSLYDNSLFVGVEISSKSVLARLLGDTVAGEAEVDDETIETREERLAAIMGLLEFSLAPYSPRRMGIRADVYCEPAEAIAYALTNYWRPVHLTTGRIGQSMLSEYVWCGRETVEFQQPGHSSYAAAFGMQHYLAGTPPGVFDRLLSSSFRHTLYHSFRFLPQHEAQKEMRRKHAHMVMGHDPAVTQRDELVRAADQLGSQLWVIGDHCMTLLAFAADPKELRQVANAAWSLLSSCGGTIAREGLALEAAWASICPGNRHLRPRPGMLSSLNLACMAPLHAYPKGKARGYWGEPFAVFRTASGEPYKFHLHVGDVGNMLVTGRTGSGKSVMLGFLIAQSERFGARLIIWDKDRGLKMLVLALGGSYLELGYPTWIAPLKRLDNTPADRDFLGELIKGLILSDEGKPLTAEDERRLALSVRTVMELPPEHRNLWSVRAFLGVGDDSAGMRLEKWCHGRERGWVIDNEEDRVHFDNPVVGFDKTYILDHSYACSPVMAVLYHYADRIIGENNRAMFVDDEFQKSLQIESFADLVANQLSARSRKGNCPTIFATQSPRTILKHRLSAIIREQCPSHMVFAPGEPSWEDWGEDGLGYTPAEFELVKKLPMGTGEFLLRQDGVSVRAQLPLGALTDEIAIMSGRKSSVRFFDKLLDETGGNIEATFDEFLKRRHAEVVE